MKLIKRSNEEEDLHKLRIHFAYFSMSIVGTGFVFLLTLIMLYCFGLIILPYYVVSPLAGGTIGCGATLIYKVAKYLFPTKSKVD